MAFDGAANLKKEFTGATFHVAHSAASNAATSVIGAVKEANHKIGEIDNRLQGGKQEAARGGSTSLFREAAKEMTFAMIGGPVGAVLSVASAVSGAAHAFGAVEKDFAPVRHERGGKQDTHEKWALENYQDATGETWNHQGAKVAQPIMVNASPGRQGIMPGSRSGMDDKERLTLNNQRKDLVAQHESAVLFTEKKWGTDIGDFKGGPKGPMAGAEYSLGVVAPKPKMGLGGLSMM